MGLQRPDCVEHAEQAAPGHDDARSKALQDCQGAVGHHQA